MLSLVLQNIHNLLVLQTILNLIFSLKDLFSLLMRELVSCSPFFPKYGRFIQITFLSSLLLLILSFLLTFDFSLLIIKLRTYLGYAFHDINVLIWLICCWKACLLLQILLAQWNNALINAVFKSQGVWLWKLMYCPVWVSL